MTGCYVKKMKHVSIKVDQILLGNAVIFLVAYWFPIGTWCWNRQGKWCQSICPGNHFCLLCFVSHKSRQFPEMYGSTSKHHQTHTEWNSDQRQSYNTILCRTVFHSAGAFINSHSVYVSMHSDESISNPVTLIVTLGIQPWKISCKSNKEWQLNRSESAEPC